MFREGKGHCPDKFQRLEVITDCDNLISFFPIKLEQANIGLDILLFDYV